jgi:hypothetical protein
MTVNEILARDVVLMARELVRTQKETAAFFRRAGGFLQGPVPVSQGTISHWLKGERPISQWDATEIERVRPFILIAKTLRDKGEPISPVLDLIEAFWQDQAKINSIHSLRWESDLLKLGVR